MVRNTNLDPGFKELLDSFPDKLLEMTGIGADHLDFMSYMDMLMKPSYATIADVSSDPNANVAQTTVASSMQESSKPLMKIYCLNELYKRARDKWGKTAADRMLTRVFEGGLYPSDLHMLFMPYCFNFSASWLMYKGLPFIARTQSSPARHADSFVQHATQLIMYASNHQSGAVALTGFFTAYAWYAKRDGLSKKEMVQDFQNFTYTINQPVRFSAQTPFVNLSIFDRHYLTSLYGDMQYPDGTTPDIDYVMEVQKVYIEWFISEIQSKGIVFTFPVLTASILLDPETNEPKDDEFVDWLVKVNAEYALINIYMSKKASSLSSCCRLSNDIDALAELGYVNSFGAGGDGIGSVGVATVNLPHVALQYEKQRKAAESSGEETKAEIKSYDSILDSYAEDARRIVVIRREWVADNIKRGLLPLYDHGFIDINSQYCTVGITGMYEAFDFAGGDISDLDSYKEFAKNSLAVINRGNLEAAKETGYPFNLEQVPAENQAVKLASKDMALGLQNKFRMYSNQWVPLTGNLDVIMRMNLAGELDTLCGGGAILHVTVEGKVTAAVQKKLLQLAAKMGVIYFAFNYVLSRCKNCSTITQGDIFKCPHCGSTNIEAFSRVVGFVTPVDNWHKERRSEFHKRTRYNLDARQKTLAAGTAGAAAD